MPFSIMTRIGRNKEAASLANGTPINITHIAWGDGDRIPNGAETALLSEQGRKAVQGQSTPADNLNAVNFDIEINLNEGPFVVREAGLFDDDGDMIAVAQFDPPQNKPLDVSLLLRIMVVFSDLENVVVRVQSSNAFVPAERRIVTGDGILGGGSLAEDRELYLAFATEAMALTGQSDIRVMTPLRSRQQYDAYSASFGAMYRDEDNKNIDLLLPHIDDGLYQIGNPGTWPVLPFSIGYLHIKTIATNENAACVQVARTYRGSAAARNLTFTRERNVAGEWSSWVTLLSDGGFVGTVTACAGSTAPEGWLECDGSTISRSSYAPLYGVIGDTYGNGNGASTFNLPDLRGEFLRGWDNGRSVDTGRALGSAQGDELRAHRHDMWDGFTGSLTHGTQIQFNQVAGAGQGDERLIPDGMEPFGGAETRPRNVALMFCIKY